MESKPERLVKKTFIACIRNSVGTKMFRNFYLKQDGRVFDAMKNGELSCAFYVSALLVMAGFIESVHGTVESTITDLEGSGWVLAQKPAAGDIIVWEPQADDDERHKHIGFYIGHDKAVSNSSTKRRVVQHNSTFDGTRKVVAIYTNSTLDSLYTYGKAQAEKMGVKSQKDVEKLITDFRQTKKR